MTTASDSTTSGRDPTGHMTTASWTSLYEANARPLYRYLLRLTLGNRTEAEDYLQETFLRAWRWSQEHRLEPATLRPWLFTVARRIAIDAARARQLRPTDAGVDVTTLPGTDNDIDRFVQAHVIRNALRTLNPDHRAALIELYYHQRTAREAADVLGVPEGTVKSRAHYALRALHAAATATERRRPVNTPSGRTNLPRPHRPANSESVRDARRSPATASQSVRTSH